MGIIPQAEKDYANPYCHVVISTRLGHARNFVTAYSGDAVVVIGGGVGTAIEVKIAYLKAKPVEAIKGGSGVADEIGGKHLDDRCPTKVMMKEDPAKALNKVFGLST